MQFETSRNITTSEFRDLLIRSTLGQRRPIDNSRTLEAMINNADLICTASDNDKLVAIARSVTDFEYCCYLSDLAVDVTYQHRGLGKQLIELTKQQLGDHTTLILLSAPIAVEYYPKIGFNAHNSAWTIKSREPLTP